MAALKTSETHEKPTIRTWIYLNILKRPMFRPVFHIFEKANLIVFHWDLRSKKFRGRCTTDRTYYVRRGAGKNDIAGLVGTYYLVGAEVYKALQKGWIPYVDFARYPCQYSVDRPIHGTKNAWEYYFEQPCGTRREEVKNGKKIIVSGWEIFNTRKEKLSGRGWNSLTDAERKAFFVKYMPIKKYIRDEVQHYYDAEFKGRSVLGVFLRGTDYTARKPIGHAVQPTVEQVEEKINVYLETYAIDRIFLVTEDADIYDYMKEKFGGLIFCSDYNFVRFNTKSDKWVKDAFHNDPYERGKNYLIRVMLLSQCKYYIGSQASGSRYATDFGEFESSYVFNLGVY